MLKKFRYSLLSAIAIWLVACSSHEATTDQSTHHGTPIITHSEHDLVNELLGQMTLEEKLAQISCVWFGKSEIYNSDGSFNPEKMREAFPHGIGCFARPQDTIGMEGPDAKERDVNDSTVVRRMSARTPAQTVDLTNSIQKWMIEETRLGIPTLFHEEGLHGFQGRFATSFPQSIALASTFDLNLVEKVFSITAREIRARGAHHVLSPVVDVALDPRWGRIEETYGEDPYLVSQMGKAAVIGFQGTGFPIADDKVLTTLKHMTGHGQPEAGMNIGPAQISERILREVFFPPFETIVTEVGPASVMASYNEIDGIPSHANDWLLNDVLREEWGFDGVVVADYFAISELHLRHKIVPSIDAAGALALKSGVDVELPDGAAFNTLLEQVESGALDIEYIDQAVRRMLEMKVRGNVFETPYSDADYAEEVTGNDEARAVALEAAHKAAVLLKNDNNLLPLNETDYQTIAIIGPNSDIVVLGGYSDEPRQTISILEGVKNKVGDDINILHAKGVELTNNRSWWDDEVYLVPRDENLERIEQAVQIAKQADLIILAIGGDESTSREAWSETHMGDRHDITLIGEQEELVEALVKTDKPIVGVIISGRPLSLANVEDNLSAILYGWQLGQETGTAVADLLFGDVNPSGKLPVTIPRSVGHIPVFYYHKPTARRGFAFQDSGPLYPFGYGLSYTNFNISAPVLASETISSGDEGEVSVTVTNTGEVAGAEIVQLYIRDKISSVTRPVKELKGFERVELQPGETQTVTLSIKPLALQFYNRDMKRVIESGEFEILVGNSSENLQSTTLTVQ